MELPTVEIVNEKAKSGFTRINESDFDPKVHTLFGAPFSVGPVEIPTDWADLHHMKKIALAEKIMGADLVLAEGQTKTDAAEAVIKAEVERRANG